MSIDPKKAIVVGAIWRRKSTGALVRITRAIDATSDWNSDTYYDISWETVDKPVRRGTSFEEYWLRNCEPIATTPPTDTASAAGGGDRG